MGPALLIGSLVATAAGTAINAMGAMEQGSANAAMARFQQQVALRDAQVARQNARWDIQQGEAQATNEGLKTRFQVGAIKSGQAAGGITVGTGSAPTVRAGQEAAGLMSAKNIMSNAGKNAYAEEIKGWQAAQTGTLYGYAAKQDIAAGDISAAGDVASGTASMLSQASTSQAQGAFASMGDFFAAA